MTTLPLTDVCLILEGTYPYVRGGVSSWIHSIVTGLPDITFSLLVISADRRQAAERQYVLPPNVRAFVEVYIHESIADRCPRAGAAAKTRAWEAIRRWHLADGPSRRQCVAPMLAAMGDPERRAIGVDEAFHAFAAWEFLRDRYEARAAGTSFIDYFWTWRAVHAPVFQAMIAEIPPARVYHPISTGYAGLLGVLAKARRGRPMLLTEHGIYVRERAIDIGKSEWIYEEPVRLHVPRAGANPLKEMWINFFVELGRMAYDAADQIITLFEGNRAIQHELGADPAKTSVVPNGVKLDVFAAARAARPARAPGPGASAGPAGSDRPPRVGFVGRVVPIKDVKHLIKACAMIAEARPEVEFWVVGPTDEDPAYFDECQALVELLGVEKLRFTGAQNVREIYPEIDVLVLTSVSEGQPLSVLEAACAGVPAVATDVGACRELIEGSSPEDRALGPGGIVTPMGDPKATAAALLEILGDPARLERMSRAAVTRAERYYGEAAMLARYRQIYQDHIARPDRDAPGLAGRDARAGAPAPGGEV